MFESLQLMYGERLAESEQGVPEKEQTLTRPLINIIFFSLGPDSLKSSERWRNIAIMSFIP
jgi:hypothetical protein